MTGKADSQEKLKQTLKERNTTNRMAYPFDIEARHEGP